MLGGLSGIVAHSDGGFDLKLVVKLLVSPFSPGFVDWDPDFFIAVVRRQILLLDISEANGSCPRGGGRNHLKHWSQL